MIEPNTREKLKQMESRLVTIKAIVEDTNSRIIAFMKGYSDLEYANEKLQEQVDEFKKTNQWLVDTIEQLRKNGKL